MHDRGGADRVPGVGYVRGEAGYVAGQTVGATGGISHAMASRAIVDAGVRLVAAGLVAGQDGNISVRMDDDLVLVTPAGMGKGRMTVDDLVRVDLDGRVVGSPNGRPSSELAVHLAIYRARVDARAAVHAHPPTATGFALAGEDFMAPLLPEIILGLGGVPLVPYATPGSGALGINVEAAIHGHDALLLANHGAVTLGSTLEQALQRMEILEHAARIILTARLLGRVNPLTPEQLKALHELRDGVSPGGASTFAQESAR